jgi:hypothetical protein
MSALGRWVFGLVSVFVVLGAPLSARATPPQIYVFHTSYTMLDATFSTTDGCVSTVAEIASIASRTQNPAESPETALLITATVERWTVCPAYELQLNAFGSETYAGATVVAPASLTRASLQGSVPVPDSVTNQTFNLAIDLSWTCPGPAVPSPYIFQEHESTFTINLHGQVRLNAGCQANGSVSDGTTPYALSSTTNVFVAAGQSGKVDIFR